MEASLFDFAAERIEHHTSLDRIEARGTLRIALKKSGLDAARVTTSQLCVVLGKVMPRELEARGVENAPAICDVLTREITVPKSLAEAPHASDPFEVFRRLSGA